MENLLRYKRYPCAVLFAVMLIIFVPVASFSLVINYTYDNTGRLTKVNYGSGEKIQSYQYDAAGNITAYSVIDTSPDPGDAIYRELWKCAAWLLTRISP